MFAYENAAVLGVSMIAQSATELALAPMFLKLDGLLAQCPVYLKIEGLNVAGSIKLKTALQIIRDLERNGRLRAGGNVVESSSGNLGLALAIICSARGYEFTCVGDQNMPELTRRLIRLFGGKIVIVSKRDAAGGFLQTRLDVIRDMLARDKDLLWTNQYANDSNVMAHYNTTGPEILQEFPAPSWVFVGAGTTGTVMGCAKYLRERSPRTRLVAVDSQGSITFGGAPGKRYLSGLGTSRRPEIANASLVDEIVFVAEADAVSMCRRVVRDYALLVGASTGSVLAGVEAHSAEIASADIVVAVSPDLGWQYTDTVYDDEWVQMRFPEIPDNRRSAKVVDLADR